MEFIKIYRKFEYNNKIKGLPQRVVAKPIFNYDLNHCLSLLGK